MAMLGLGALPSMSLTVIDLAMPACLAMRLARQIPLARSWRNICLLGALLLFVLANAVLHWQASRGLPASQGAGMRMGGCSR
jgi:uncharacterized protein involved in response to NO